MEEKKVKDYKSYEELAITTKCYSDKVAMPYVALGLLGELGELYEKLKERSSVELTESELMDINWYLAASRVEFQLKERVEWPKETEVLVGPYDLPIQLGKIAEQIKKYLRDDWKDNEEVALPQKRKDIIQEAWDNALQLIVDLNAQVFGTPINEQCQKNIDKLADRMKRNQIHGSGDVR